MCVEFGSVRGTEEIRKLYLLGWVCQVHDDG